jgi:hypothetical protein
MLYFTQSNVHHLSLLMYSALLLARVKRRDGMIISCAVDEPTFEAADRFKLNVK